ncbi:unnamed protein product [Linum trigynum]|uniref:Uncharacterized protein n=1 Tax=Linum trigynum TaxID=586398 RepID=A0AAV2GP89_9ROSI
MVEDEDPDRRPRAPLASRAKHATPLQAVTRPPTTSTRRQAVPRVTTEKKMGRRRLQKKENGNRGKPKPVSNNLVNGTWVEVPVGDSQDIIPSPVRARLNPQRDEFVQADSVETSPDLEAQHFDLGSRKSKATIHTHQAN